MSRFELVTLNDTIYESENLVEASIISTSKSLQITTDIKELGSKIIDQLEVQGQKIEMIAPKLDEITNDLNDGERQVRSIKSIFGAMRNKIVGRKKIPKSKNKSLTVSSEPSFAASSQPSAAIKTPNVTRQMLLRGDFDHLSGDTQRKINDIEDHLDQISDNLDIIAQMSKSIADHLDSHHNTLSHTGQKMDTTQNKLNKLSDKTKQLL